MTNIYQGRSSDKPFFLIADPCKNPRVKIGDQILCIHPRSKQQTKGIALTRWTFDWDKNPLSGLILLEYGVSKDVLRQALEELHPDFNDVNVSLILIQEIQ